MDLPAEYVLHLLPLMAICGIPPPQAQQSVPVDKGPQRQTSTEQLTSPGGSVLRPRPALASIPYIEKELGQAILKLIDQWRTLALWEPLASKERQVPAASLEGVFRVIPVDRSFRLPPQKARVGGDSISERDREAHSPLSPLTPDSPLYPDGIMTTMWIRKHRDIIPSIFVSLYELRSDEKPNNLADEDLARHLIDLKKSYAERGVKLCAVLTGSWEPEQVTNRLDYLRRNSNLDSKTGLFYLPYPTSESTLIEFFKVLRQSQYPFAIEHYRLRFNKAKRRRPRIPPAQPNQPTPLDSKGWSVRQNFKLGTYSEYKQELDIAVKFYDLAYNELIDLFSSTAILPPRAKRWTEARILADSLAYKLCKLLLYLGEHGRVVHTFHSHNKRMAGLCNGWGLGRETAEYWAWLGRNYRVFAELVDISETTIVPENEIEEAMKMITGDTILNADMVLQHPGYYYLLAGECVRRQDSRTVAKEDEKETGKGGNLNGLLFENLSLSAEHFAKHGNRRTAAYVELARCKTHHFMGKYDVALELLQPIVQIYREERWYELLEEALLLALDCSKELNDDSNTFRFSLELLSDEFHSNTEEALRLPPFLSPDLSPPSFQPTAKTQITLTTNDFISFIKPTFTFQTKTAFAGSPIAFQLTLTSNSRKFFPAIVFATARVQFNEQIPEIVMDHTDTGSEAIQRFLGNITRGDADLSLRPGQTKVFEFSYTPVAQAQIEVISLSLTLESDRHLFKLVFPFTEMSLSTDGLWYSEHAKVPKVLRLGNPQQLMFRPSVGLTTNLHSPAYTGEKLPIILTLENGESETVFLEIEYEPLDDDSEWDPFSWTSDSADLVTGNAHLIGDIAPGAQHNCQLLFRAPTTPTDCTLALTMKYTLASDRMTEIRKTLALDIPVIQPFHANFDILPRIADEGGMPDPFTEGEFILNVQQAWVLTSSLSRLGSETLEVRHIGVTGKLDFERMVLEVQEGKGCSATDDGVIVLETTAHTVDTTLVVSRPADSQATPLHLKLLVTWRRQGIMTLQYEWNTISVPIPELTFFPFAPRVLTDLIALNRHPGFPQNIITYTFENPTPLLLNLDVRFESNDECAFSGPSTFRLTLLAFSSHALKVIVTPLKGEWAMLPRIFVLDDERKRYLEILRTTDDLKVEGQEMFVRVPVFP